MAIQTRAALLSAFVSGTAATEQKFQDLLNSFYSIKDDSVLLGPSGQTGMFGMIGPTGGTENGLIGPTGGTFFKGAFVSSDQAPLSWTASGYTGQIISSPTGMYYHTGSYWLYLSGSTAF